MTSMVQAAFAITTDQIVQIVVGFVAALIGALVGGFFVVFAVRVQARHDREDESRRAAGRILTALFPLEGVFATLLSRQPVTKEQAAASFNAFSSAASADLPFVADDQVRERVLAHNYLCGQVVEVTFTLPPPPPILEAVRRHADAKTEALEAHIRDIPLPLYTPLPRKENGVLDVQGLIAWEAKP